MNSKEKRSNGGYGLRRKIAKKKLDEDFEYYSGGAGPQTETSTSANVAQEKHSDKLQTHLVVVTKLVNPQEKVVLKDECLEKRPRGRPKKHHLTHKDVLDSSSYSTEIRSKILKSSKPVENVEFTKIDEAKEEHFTSVAQEVKVEHHLEAEDTGNTKLGILTSDGMTELQEEEVSSLPEGEKENLPEDGINLVSEPDIEERMVVQMGNEEIQDEYDHDLTYEEYENVSKGPSVLIMKHKRENLSNEDIQKLNQLNPDDKIECNECHKLLKPSSFRQHLRTHTGEKPFGCEVCEARFTRKGDVERHVRIVHNKQKPFKCSLCQRAFGDKKNLRWHLMNHDKKLFYICEVCGFKFGKREYWENHVRFIHPAQGALDLDGDSSVPMEDDSEDNLHSLTATILGADESSENSTNQTRLVIRSIQEKKQEAVVSAIPLPLLNQLSQQEGIKFINIKNISNLVKVTFPKKESAGVYGQAVSSGEQEGIEAVVIEVDDTSASSSTIHSQYAEQPPSNIIHIVNSSKILPDVKVDKNEQQKKNKLVVETHITKKEPVAELENVQYKTEQEESEDRRNATSVQYNCNENGQSSKVISFMLKDNSASSSDGNGASVQTLIEALLVAAKGDGQQKDSQST